MSAAKDKDNAKNVSADAGHGHSAADDHDLFTVPPFVAENSVHDWLLSLLAVACAFGIIYLMIYWSTLPLPAAIP